MSKYNRYVEVIWVGFGIWTLGSGLLILADRNISLGIIALFIMMIGAGTGLTFQPTLVALQAHCPKAQRAVATSNRNFIRSAGGAVGLAVSSAILANVLKSSLPSDLAGVANSTFAAPNLSGFSPTDRELIISAYTDASKAVFIWCAPLVGLAFLLTSLIRDHGLVRKEDQAPAAQAEPESLPRQDAEEKMPPYVEQSTDVSRAMSMSSEKSSKDDRHP